MKRPITLAMAALLCLAPSTVVQADNHGGSNKYKEAVGSYFQGGLAIVKTNYDADLDSNIGFAIAGGQRINEWLGADVEFYWAWRDQGADVDTSQFGTTLNAKFYPMGMFAPDTLDFIQPYFAIGLGGGNSKFDVPGPNNKDGTFIFRIGGGAEWLITKRFGAYADFSLDATPGLERGGNGGATGVVQFGAAFHF
jgi:opacity protein-like surface antigen